MATKTKKATEQQAQSDDVPKTREQLVQETIDRIFENLKQAWEKDLETTKQRLAISEDNILNLSTAVYDKTEELKDLKSSFKHNVEEKSRFKNRIEDLENNPPTYEEATVAYEKQMKEPRNLPGIDDGPVEGDPACTTPLVELGLTEAMTEKLEEHEPSIKTVSDLEDAIRNGHLQKVRGVGQSKVDQITDALMKWRESNPVPQMSVPY